MAKGDLLSTIGEGCCGNGVVAKGITGVNPAANRENIKSLLSIYLRTGKRILDQGVSGNDLTWLSF